MLTPPKTTNDAGEERRVGFEIEYLGLDLAQTARVILEAFGEEEKDGRVEKRHKNACVVNTEAFGPFNVEVDVELLQKLAETSEKKSGSDELNFEGAVEELISPLITSFAPNEVVTPPIPLSRIGELEALIDLMREKGAEGTGVSISYAFGLHINPEAPSLEADSIRAHIQSFLLLYEWMQEEMRMNFSRKVTSFAGGFPKRYSRLVLSADYKPDLPTLIDDYLEFNPTRNRALDLLPLFAFVDEGRVTSVVKDSLIKKRPTYHLRMPDCRIDDPSWQPTVEWNRWVMVEELANNEDLRLRMIEHRQSLRDKLLSDFTETWLIASRNYVERMR